MLIDTKSPTFPTKYTRNDTDYAKGWNACVDSVMQQKEACCNDDGAGRWLHQDDDYFCNKCNFSSEDIMYVNSLWKYTHYRFCPNCGTRMHGIEEMRSSK